MSSDRRKVEVGQVWVNALGSEIEITDIRGRAIFVKRSYDKNETDIFGYIDDFGYTDACWGGWFLKKKSLPKRLHFQLKEKTILF